MSKKPTGIPGNLDLIIAGAALSALILVTFTGVIMRYVVSRPIIWGEEFQLVCIILVVFFGAGAGFRLGSHVAIDIVVDRFPQKARKITEAAIYCVSMVILVYFAVQSANLVRQMYVTGRTTEILDIPYFIVYAAFPLGCILMIGNYSVAFFKKFKKLKSGEGNV
jgi:TRAP-type C4-dicarboxylate transport system permease small subunit